MARFSSSCICLIIHLLVFELKVHIMADSCFLFCKYALSRVGRAVKLCCWYFLLEIWQLLQQLKQHIIGRMIKETSTQCLRQMKKTRRERTAKSTATFLIVAYWYPNILTITPWKSVSPGIAFLFCYISGKFRFDFYWTLWWRKLKLHLFVSMTTV